MRFRLPSLLSLVLVAMLTAGADGCSSDPNVEGAKLNLRNENYDEALRNLSVALEADPDNVEALTLKAQVLATQMERLPVAERAALIPEMVSSITRASNLAPEDPEVAQIRAFSWGMAMTIGNQSLRNDATPSSESVPFFTGAVELAPDSSASHYSLGLAQLLDGKNAEAADALETAVDLEPTYANAYIYLSKAYLGLDRGSEAVDILQTALDAIPATDPDAERIQQEYLNTLATSGQTERAIAEFESRLEDNGDDPLIRYNYGTLLLGVERFEDAIEQFTFATTIEDDNADAFYNLGVAHLRLAGRIETEANELGLDASQNDYDALIEQRDEQIEMSLEALTIARDIADDAAKPAVCNTLLTIYNSLGRADEAADAAECAGVDIE